MNIDLNHLETIAKEATQGAWRFWNPWDGTSHISIGNQVAWESKRAAAEYGDDESIPHWADATHIATFDPPTVLALIARIRELETENERLKGRRRERRKDDRKSLIEEMQATPEGRARLANARYNIEYERVEELEATLQRVRDARSNHPEVPECDRYTDDDTIKCGWKSAVESIDKALEGEPK